MHLRLSLIAAALMASTTPTWAATASLPTYETYAAADDFTNNFFGSSAGLIPQSSITTTPGAVASITQFSDVPISNPYTASASTNLGSNHVFAQASAFPSGAFGAASFSGWYDQVTISGGTGMGTAQFTVQLSGTVDVGAIAGVLGYTLGTSTVHPSQLTSTLNAFMIAPPPWPMDAVNPIATYLLGASPYNDTSILSAPLPPGGIPSINDPSLSLGDAAMGFPTPDLILTPGAGQNVNVTLHGTLNFAYGEAFYLIGGLNTGLFNAAPFITFCSAECPPPPTIDGTGATTLDFSSGANLVGIALPEGATASFASGNAYNVTAVPEPAEWLLLLAGLGLVGWRARRRA